MLPSIWRSVYVRVKGDSHLAEDIVSETMLALIKAVSAPEMVIVCPSAWLRTVATNKLQDHFRAAARVQHLIEQASSMCGSNGMPDPPALQEASEQRAAVRKAMDDLPEQHRLVLEWKYIDRSSVREIATRLSMTEKAVESILFRARRDLRDALGRLHLEDAPFPLSRNGHNQGTRIPASGSHGSESRVEVETRASAGFDELKQRQSR